MSLSLPSPSLERPLLSEGELAKALNVAERTLRDWRKRRVIPFMKLGGLIRYDQAAVILALVGRQRAGKVDVANLPPNVLELLREVLRPMVRELVTQANDQKKEAA